MRRLRFPVLISAKVIAILVISGNSDIHTATWPLRATIVIICLRALSGSS